MQSACQVARCCKRYSDRVKLYAVECGQFRGGIRRRRVEIDLFVETKFRTFLYDEVSIIFIF